ncbi:MAG: hypothetical protein NTX72_04550 [Candidatus Uhrbacteria bacterium]|nr:hypothetical protein [Candidatus Uhrbacteria bacterium]
MSTRVLKVLVIVGLAIVLAIAVTKLIPFLVLGAGGYALYKVFGSKKPPTNP